MNRRLKGSRVLVTGGTGFIGTHLVRRLESEGCEVHLLVRDPSRWIGQGRTRAVLHAGDLQDAGSLRRVARSVRPRYFFSLAAVRSGDGNDSRPDVRATIRTAQVLRATVPRVRRWVRTGVRLTQDFNRGSEAALDFLLGRRYGLPIVTLRLFRVYGPGQRGDDFIPSILDRVRRSLAVELPREEGWLDFVHVEDVVNAYILAASRDGVVGRAFDIGGGAPVLPGPSPRRWRERSEPVGRFEIYGGPLRSPLAELGDDGSARGAGRAPGTMKPLPLRRVQGRTKRTGPKGRHP